MEEVCDCDGSRTKKSDFSAETFVETLINEGANIPCDNTNDKYNDFQLPTNYDEAKFKRGQEFYHYNIFSLFFGKLMGLVTLLAIPNILKILMMTNMSGTPLKSYKRYMATIIHMNIWYNYDFRPGSKIWKSMQLVRKMHNSASKRSCVAGSKYITQLDMALTQFGFMGYALTNPKQIGLINYDEYGLECWVYLWRTVGDMMGIEERFNICRGSVQETREICEQLLQKQFRPYVEQQDPDFLEYATVLIDGMWVMQPLLNPKVMLTRLFKILNPTGELFKKAYADLTDRERRHLKFAENVMATYHYTLWRIYHNTVMYISLWLMKYFPFLAIWRFGFRDAYVRVLDRASMISVRGEVQSG